MTITHSHTQGKRVATCLVFALAFVSMPLLAQDVTSDNCVENLAEARNRLFLGDFDGATSLIQPCIEANLYTDPADQVQAYELLASVYIATGNEQDARLAVANLLDVDPDYTPDPDQSLSDYVALVDELKGLRPPPTPVFYTAGEEGANARLVWIHPNDPIIAGYVVFRGTSEASLAPIDTLDLASLQLSTLDVQDSTQVATYLGTGQDEGVTYYYAIQSIRENLVGSAFSEVVNITIPDSSPEPVASVEESERKPISRWVFIGGGVVAGGVLAAVLLSSDPNPTVEPPVDGLSDLPGPPPPNP